MNSAARRMTVILSVMAMVLVCTVLAHALPRTNYVGSWSTNGYTFYWQTNQHKAWINEMASLGYIGQALIAAYKGTALPRTTQLSSINVRFYSADDGAGGWGGSEIAINTYYGGNSLSFSKVLAHETAHVLFARHIKPEYWGWSGNANASGYKTMQYYGSMLSEALALYTDRCVYAYGPKMVKSYIKSQISYFFKHGAGSLKSMWEYEKIYTEYYSKSKPSATDTAYFHMATWQLTAFGQFLHTSRNGAVGALMNKLISYRGSLASKDYTVSQNWFERAFQDAYGKYSNTRWIHSGGYMSTKFLYGEYYLSYVK